MRGLGDAAPELLTYVVHGHGNPDRLHFWLDLDERELQTKRDAIACHRSQLHLSRERFLAYARAKEEFFEPEFDLVCTESRAKVRIGAFRHSCRVVFGRAAREALRGARVSSPASSGGRNRVRTPALHGVPYVYSPPLTFSTVPVM